jgi:translation initiation factor 1 (eIF-1/SUI1)
VSGLRLGILDRFAKKSEGTVKVTVDVDGKREVTTTISGKKNVAELDFRHAGESLKVTLSSTDGRNKPVCLMFSDASWYGRE